MASGILAIIVIVAAFGIILCDQLNQRKGGRENV
jgi:hypothetical protein